MRTVAIIQARMGSSRLPGKSLMDLGGRPVLAWMTDAARRISGLDGVAVATSTHANDDPIAAFCAEAGVPCHRGSEQDVLSRYAAAARAEKADIVMRLTGDCPLLDPAVCDQLLLLRQHTGAVYACNADPHSWPHGLDCEVFTAQALYIADTETDRPTDREHVTPYLRNNRQRFPAVNLPCPIPGLKHERWTLDHPEDLKFLREVVARLPQGRPHTYVDVMRIVGAEPALRAINAEISHEEGRIISLLKEKLVLERSFTGSRALASQHQLLTHSSILQPGPSGNVPLILTRGHGGRCWDVDGNEYVDLLDCGLLGHRDDKVDDAMRAQLHCGTGFGRPLPVELALTRRLAQLVPGAECVRLGRDAAAMRTLAIAAARRLTGRDTVIETAAIDSVEAITQCPDAAVAAVVVDGDHPAAAKLERWRSLADTLGAVLIVEEGQAGLRLHPGGIQARYGVVADLACFGSTLGNGAAIAALTGRADLMAAAATEQQPTPCDPPAAAAALVVLDRLEREAIAGTLWRTGETLGSAITERIAAHGLSDVLRLVGAPPCQRLMVCRHQNATEEQIRHLVLAELLRAGVLTQGGHPLSLAHDQADLNQIVTAYDHACSVLATALANGSL